MFKAFLLLCLGHLLGDFVLQNSKIARGKSEHFSWLFLHSMIIWICSACLIIPAWTLHNLLIISGLAGIHFGIDMIKLCFQKKSFSKTFGYFILDQVLHVLSILFISPFLSVAPSYLPQSVAFLAITALMNTYFLDIFLYVFRSKRKPMVYSRDWMGYAFRGPSFFIWVWNGYAGGTVLLIGALVQFRLTQSLKGVGRQYGLCFVFNLCFFWIWRLIF